MPNESRLDQLRDQAWEKSPVTGRGVDVAGGPIPRKAGYYGQPVVKPPVWTWEIPVYFFVGGLGGMSALIAVAALLFRNFDVARTAMWIAAIVSVLSPVLLILDLGRPRLFINMLRVFKPQSVMSMGAWILDFVAAWAGEWGTITHANAQYRNPAFTGDATFLNGSVTDTRVERRRHHVVTVKVELTNQDDAVMAKADVDVELPDE